MVVRVIPSTCSECLVRCGSLVHVEDDRVVKITGNPAHPASQGAFCMKGINGPISNRDNPARITHPLRRTGERGGGQWERISWDQAVGEIADRLAAVKAVHGGRAIAGAVANHAQSRGVAVRLLLRSLGSPNLMINQDLCHGCRATGSMLTGLGGNGADAGTELAVARMILVVGKSPSESQVVEWSHLQHAVKNGARLMVVDPRRTHAARLAHTWLRVNPGTDVALALAMIHVIFSEDLYDHAFIAEFCIGAEELRARAADYAPQSVAELVGIPAESIIAAARAFATTRPACLMLGHGVDAQANGVQTTIAFQALLGLTGNIDKPGTNRLAKRLPGYVDNHSTHPDLAIPRALEEQTIGAVEYPLWSGPTSWAKAAHNPSLLRAVLTGDPYPVRAMIISGANITCTYPDHDTTVAALTSLDLLVVASDQMTPTAELADYFLPKTTLLEEEDLIMDTGGPCVSLTQRILAPLGEARSDIDIAVALRAACAARGLVEYDALPWASHREFLSFMLEKTGVGLDDLRASGFHTVSVTRDSYRETGFRTPSGKFEFHSSRLVGLLDDVLPSYRAPVYATAQEGFDLTLLTGIRSMPYQNSRFRDAAWARRVQDAPELRIHPATAARRSIGADDWVWVQTRADLPRCLLKVRITDEVPEHIVATGMGWWYPEMSGPDRGASLFNIGTAVGYGPSFDPISGSAEARNTACRVTRAETEDVALLLREVRRPQAAALNVR